MLEDKVAFLLLLDQQAWLFYVLSELWNVCQPWQKQRQGCLGYWGHQQGSSRIQSPGQEPRWLHLEKRILQDFQEPQWRAGHNVLLPDIKQQFKEFNFVKIFSVCRSQEYWSALMKMEMVAWTTLSSRNFWKDNFLHQNNLSVVCTKCLYRCQNILMVES